MKDLLLIVQKELTELLRDKKTIINSILLPTLLIPLLIFGSIKVTKMIADNNQQKKVTIGLVNAPQGFMQLIKADTLNAIIAYNGEADFKALINEGTIETALVFPTDWHTRIDSLSPAEVQIIRNGTMDNVNERVSNVLQAFDASLRGQRMERLGLSAEKLTPFREKIVEIGEQKELIGKRIGGFIPYLFILSMWGGCVLAAIDLVTGEKERKTIETTLSLPVSKFTVLLGKAIVASLLGFIPALLNLVGLIVGLKLIDDIPDTFKVAINEMLSFQSVTMILLLLIPFSLFLSGLIIAMIAGASTFKEAQSKVTPIIMLIILPLVLAMMPGIELTWSTVLVPVLNIGLGVKEIMAGTIDMGQYAVILVSLVAFAVGSIFFSYKKFSDENAILK